MWGDCKYSSNCFLQSSQLLIRGNHEIFADWGLALVYRAAGCSHCTNHIKQQSSAAVAHRDAAAEDPWWHENLPQPPQKAKQIHLESTFHNVGAIYLC